MSNFKLTTWEIVSTLIIISLVPVLLTLPRYTAIIFSTGTVIHSVYILAIILVLFWISSYFLTFFKDKDIIDISEIALRKIWKIFILYCIYYFFNTFNHLYFRRI